MSHAFFVRRTNSAFVQKTIKNVESVQRVNRYLASSASAAPTDASSSDIEKNAYYDKYKAKLEQKLREMEARGEAVELPSKSKPAVPTPPPPAPTSAASTDDGVSDVRGGSIAARMSPSAADSSAAQDPSKARPISAFQIRSLNSIVHLDLLQNKSAEEVAEIWKSHHLDKDCITAAIPVDKYAVLSENAETFKTFILPLPRDDGYEMFYVEFAGHQFQLTSLLNYKTLGESAPAQVTICHYTELKASHGLVLMRGEFETNFLNVLEIQCLANQLQLYYLAKEDTAHYRALETFTTQPQDFDPNIVITLLKESGMAILEQRQQEQDAQSPQDSHDQPAK